MRSHSLRRVCVLREIKKQKIDGDKVEIWRDGEMDGEIDGEMNGKDGKRMERRMGKLGRTKTEFWTEFTIPGIFPSFILCIVERV